MSHFITKDSGERIEYPSGMRRDTQKGKVDYTLIPTWFITRLAELMTRGQEKYGRDNWQLASSEEEVQRFRASGLRHHYEWLEGKRDEDHGMAVVFNLMAEMHVEAKKGVAQKPGLIGAIHFGDDEPDRTQKYIDSEGDEWSYEDNRWHCIHYYSRELVDIVDWEDICEEYFPMTKKW